MIYKGIKNKITFCGKVQCWGDKHLHEPGVKDLSPSTLNSEPSFEHMCFQCSRNEKSDLWE